MTPRTLVIVNPHLGSRVEIVSGALSVIGRTA